MRRCLPAVIAALGLAGCALDTAAPHPAAPVSIIVDVTPPPAVSLALERPVAVAAGARAAGYATTAGAPLVTGIVSPADATVYVRSPDGSLAQVNPGAGGRFAVRAELEPGANAFALIGYRLGFRPRTLRLAITWRGRGADAAQAAAVASPAIPAGAADPGGSSGATPAPTVTVDLDPISAPAPPATGGDGRWLGGFELTEYYPALESWFSGRLVPAPGLGGEYPIDWLYSAHGLSMEGEGIAADGQWIHIAGLGAGGWLTAGGSPDAVFGDGVDAPYWRTGGFWRTASGAVTYPLQDGDWSAGAGVRYVPPPAGISFAPGPAKPLSYLRSVAVDPRVIALGSYVYIPAYAAVNGGWFQAQDTGGAIVGRHIDVFTPPPASPDDLGNFATGQDVYIVAPGQPPP